MDLVPTDDVPENRCKELLQGQDDSWRSVSLIHEDSPALRRMAVFDILVNNPDRKGNHVLTMTVAPVRRGSRVDLLQRAQVAYRAARLDRRSAEYRGTRRH